MVCVYCGGKTQVTNSRAQKRNNQVWRRRYCIRCGALFTTHETLHLSSSFHVKTGVSQEPFLPDRLFADLLNALRDRDDRFEAARELTGTITQNLVKNAPEALILPHEISLEVSKVLKRFDAQAYLRFVSEHPSLAVKL